MLIHGQTWGKCSMGYQLIKNCTKLETRILLFGDPPYHFRASCLVIKLIGLGRYTAGSACIIFSTAMSFISCSVLRPTKPDVQECLLPALCNLQYNYNGIIQHHQLLCSLVVNELVFADGCIALHSRITHSDFPMRRQTAKALRTQVTF